MRRVRRSASDPAPWMRRCSGGHGRRGCHVSLRRTGWLLSARPVSACGGLREYPQRLPCVGVCRTHHHRGSLLAVRRCDGVWWRDHRSGQHHHRRRGGDTGHPAQQYRCRCTRQSAAADRRARPPACMGEVCEERTAQCAAVTTKPGSNYKNLLKHNGTYAQGQHKKYRSEQCKAEDDVPDSVHCPPLLLFL